MTESAGLMAWIESVMSSSELSLMVLPAALVLGALGAVSSCCTYPAIGVVAGYSAVSESADRRGAVTASLSFILGTFIALVALGAVAGLISRSLAGVLGRYWLVFAGLGSIAFGLAALRLIPFKVPKFVPSRTAGRGGLVGAALLGLLVGGATTACNVSCNPVLAVFLGIAVLKGQILWGGAVLGLFAVGHSVPLALALVGLSLGKTALKGKWILDAVRITGGIVLMVVGFYFLFQL